MAIYVPGKRTRNNKVGSPKRTLVAVLSLTAMVDLFTVLVVFLLQNYATTGVAIDIPEGVKLPAAKEVKDLKPANVVVISATELRVNNMKVLNIEQVKTQEDWLIPELETQLADIIKKGEDQKKEIGQQLKTAVSKIQNQDNVVKEEDEEFRRITIQADKTVDFLTLKKVMYTITEAGMKEMNFAVLKNESGTATPSKTN